MRKYVNDTDKKNEIRLLLKHPLYKNKIILLVEGNSDIRLFRNMIQHQNISIESIDGKKDLLKVMKALAPEIPNKILSICDADYDHLRNKTEKREKYHIYLTDYHDAEMLLLSSPAITSFIHEYACSDSLCDLEENLLDRTLDIAYTIGLVRWANIEKKLNINFKGLNYSQFIDVEKLSIELNLTYFLETLIKRSKKLSRELDEEILKKYIKMYSNAKACKYQVCCGHDVTNIIALVFRQKWASQLTNMDYKRVESSLRIAYQGDYFSQTNLFKKIKNHLSALNLNIVPDIQLS